MADIGALAAGVVRGERRALARAITLIESTRDDHRTDAEELLEAVMPRTGGSVRLGATGAPGVGKSTFIEALGLHVIGAGHRVAVLAVDPTSKLSGGSILGDKTRMERLAREPGAFIRPSPAGPTLGGVARRSREAMLVCEAAGYDVVIVETVGVGQSETAVADMVDMFLLLIAPGGGDDLQGIKRGIVELADLILVNKADGDLAPAAHRTVGDYANALRLLRPRLPGWQARVQACSALSGIGVDATWDAVLAWRGAMGGMVEEQRSAQARAWMWNEIGENLTAALRRHEGVRELIGELEAEVAEGRIAPSTAVRRIMGRFLSDP